MGRGRGRHLQATLLILLVLGSCATPGRPGAAPEHVVIVSIDGLRPEFYLGAYDAPELKDMAVRGACARSVESVFPSSTYPAHATIVTGVPPARHGIYANTTWTERGSTRDWYWFAKSLRARTLWQAATEKGLKVAITYWPTSVGAQVNWVLGEIWDPDDKETVRRLATSASPGLLAELALGVGIPQEKIALDRAAIDGFVSRAAGYVFRKYRPNLQLVHLLNVDEVQHHEGPDSPEVARAVRLQDENIARIRRAIDASGVADRTTLLVVGDHGFTSIRGNLCPNVTLRDAGWLVEEDGKITSWRARVRSSGGSAAVYVRDPHDVPGVRDALRAAATVEGEVRYRVLERSELDGLGYNPEAALALDPAEGWAITERLAPGVPSVKGNHGQLPSRPGLETGFIALGAGVKPGARVGRMRLLDIAPTVSGLLGLDLAGMEGKRLDGMFEFDPEPAARPSGGPDRP